MTTSCERAGAALREAPTGGAEGQSHLAARGRFVEAAMEATRGRAQRSLAPRVVALAAAAVVALGAWAVVTTARAPLTFAMGASRSPGHVLEYIVPGRGEELPLFFSDGSVVTLDPTARARVDRTTHAGAAVVVESGGVTANVVHSSATEWAFVAGPYVVRVTGTAFRLSWDPAKALEIWMKAGSVVVRGPGAEAGVEVRDHFLSSAIQGPAGVTRRASTEDQQGATGASAGAQHDTVAGSSPPGAVAADEPVGPAMKPGAMAVRPARAGAPPGATDGTEGEAWGALVARGEYARVIDAAGRRGLGATLSGADVDDVAALGDAARLTGKTALAERALLQLRGRFPATSRARSAAFLLGRMADDAGNPSGAVGWYERYLSEAPGGSLAAEALGRRMLALRRLNDVESTQRTAKEYLVRFPQGPHAGIAREIVGR
jgi:TolA-binding protein